MFTTHRSAEMVIEGLDGSQKTQVWRCVEQEIIHPWFYLQIGRWARTESLTSMMMIHHAHELRELVDRQSNLIWLEQVQFVSPPQVNGLNRWIMEPLQRISILGLPSDDLHGLRMDVEGGNSYFLNGGDRLRSVPVAHVLFDATKHLRFT